jgi:hypothetical protein
MRGASKTSFARSLARASLLSLFIFLSLARSTATEVSKDIKLMIHGTPAQAFRLLPWATPMA